MAAVAILTANRRPWLDIYDGQGLLAQRISSTVAACGEEENDTRLPAELWLVVASSFELSEFWSVCALAKTCHGLRPLARHPELWERFCRAAYCTRGHLKIESQLRLFSWSWLKMFRLRRRLRFDGIYSIATTKRIFGLNEGRGMKETDKDYYNPAGNFVTSYRVLRFFPCGEMFSYLCSSHTPADIRKAASAVAVDNPRSLTRKLQGACWGAYDLHEVEPCGGNPAKVSLTAQVLLFNESYPNMAPTTVRYVMELRPTPTIVGGTGGGRSVAVASSSGGGSSSTAPSPQGVSLANNAFLGLTALAIESTGGELESLPVPANTATFIPFVGPLPPAAPVPKVPLASGQY